MREMKGSPDDVGGRFAIVVSQFNETITHALLDGAVETLRRHGVSIEDRVTVFWVPGAFEVPLACKRAAESGRFEAVIALSCVIRGGTPHFDYVCDAVTSGVSRVSLDTGIPVTFGVLTCDTVESALERTRGLDVPAQHHVGAGESDAATHANKGSEAALAALEMVSLGRALEA